MLSYSPSCCISSPMQSTSSSLLSSKDQCQPQETTSSITSSPILSQPRQQQNGFQEHPIRLASMSTASSPPLPPPLMIPISGNENSNTNNTSSNDHQQYHSSQHPSYQYQHRHSTSSSSSPSWTLGYPPVTPPSNQQNMLMMDQSPLYDPYPSQHHQQNYLTHFRQSPMTANPAINSTANTVMEPMFAHRGSTSSLSIMSPQHQHQHQQLKKHLRFHIVLQATTAVTQKTEHSSLTYLNRGQSYGIQLTDKFGHDGLIQSQFVIMFHDPAHRKIALNYWKFWIGQQKDPQHARAVDLDSHQSIGIMNVHYPSFDRIAFDWHGRHGAKLFVRFHCLSTDFSRIKGVKGIPLRACMSSQISTSNDPLLQQQYSGAFHHLDNNKDGAETDFLEQSYCKVKLFRDKGAERKNKDDAKQLGKQFEKMMHEGDPRQHPMWLMYNESVPYSIFSETPTSPTLESFDHAMLTPASKNTTNAAASITTATTLTNLTHSRPKQFTPKLSTSLPTLSYHYQQQQQPSSPYQQQYKHHYHPYAKRPPPPITNATTTVPTQLYSSTGYESLLPSTTATATSTASPLITSPSSTSSSSSPLLPSFVSNSNSHSSTTTATTSGESSNDSSMPSALPSFYLPTTSSGPERQLKHMSSLQEQQQIYQQQAYPYHHQQQQQQQQQNHDRFSPIPSTDASILTAWRRS